MRLLKKLSDLTDAVVDGIYNISGAKTDAAPHFVFLIGSPGAGKSSGHGAAIAAGLIQAGNYATINLDSLLENLAPYRAGTAIGHLLKLKSLSITAYAAKKENLGMFKAYNEGRAAVDPAVAAELNAVREQWASPSPATAFNVMDINDRAIKRAINNKVNVVYETTFTLNKDGRVKKFDDIMTLLEKTPYQVAVIHVTADPGDITTRLTARQEYGMPAEAYPYYRQVPPATAGKFVKDNAMAYHTLEGEFAPKGFIFMEIQNPLDPARLPAPHAISPATQLERIVEAYGWAPSEFRRLSSGRKSRRSSSSSWRPSSWKRKTRRS
jgi:hypothetical protein